MLILLKNYQQHCKKYQESGENKLRQCKNKGEEYVSKFPKLRKWINECVCCHDKGYNPMMPDKITTVEGSLEVYFIKKYFKPLELNKDGLCKTCEKIRLNHKL